MAVRTIIPGTVVLASDNIRHLTALRSTGPDGMARIAGHSLPLGMVVVAKDRPKNIPRRRGSAVRGQLVTDAARTDLALGRMTRVAIIVGLKANRDRLARTGRLVT